MRKLSEDGITSVKITRKKPNFKTKVQRCVKRLIKVPTPIVEYRKALKVEDKALASIVKKLRNSRERRYLKRK